MTLVARDRMGNTAAALKCTKWPIPLEKCRQGIIVDAFIKTNIQSEMTRVHIFGEETNHQLVKILGLESSQSNHVSAELPSPHT